MRYLEKIPNGKLVAMEIQISNSKVSSIKITGDFFIYPEETISKIEAVFIGLSINTPDTELISALEKTTENAELIGVTVEDFVRIFKKTVIL